ncbi:MAG: polysaccharide pyruvyl transferase CsaB [Halarsenatibacteraceae bacterium]
MEKIVVSGYYGYDNIGDEAILYSIIEAVKDFNRNPEIIVLSSSPEVTSRRYDVKAAGRYNLPGIISALRDADLFISGGGSLLQDVTSLKSPFYYLSILQLARLLSKKTIFFCQGVGPLNNGLVRFATLKTLEKVDLVSVRDIDSKDLLAEIGLSEEAIIKSADPVFLLSDLAETGRNLEADDPVLGISVRPWKDNSYLKPLAQGVNQLLEAYLDLKIQLIPFHQGEDERLAESLSKLLKTDKIKVLAASSHPARMIEYYGQIDLLLGVRLHSLIYAAITATPFVGISYDPKIDSFLAELAKKPAGSTEFINPDKVYESLSYNLENQVKESEQLDKFSQAKRIELKEILAQIFA